MESNNNKIQVPLKPKASLEDTVENPPITEEMIKKFSDPKSIEDEPKEEAKVEEDNKIGIKDKIKNKIKDKKNEIVSSFSDADSEKKPTLRESKDSDKTKSERPSILKKQIVSFPDDPVSVLDNGEILDSADSKKTAVDFVDPTSKSVTSSIFTLTKSRIIVLVIFVLILMVAFFGIWNRWLRYDDEKDFVSKWKISNSESVVVIDEEKIYMDKDTIWNYELDTGSKTINYKIGNKNGFAHYRFSWDRNQLAILEQGNYDFLASLFSDFCWFWDWSTCNVNSIELSPAYTKEAKNEVDTENTGLDDIMNNGSSNSILLNKIATKRVDTDN